MEGLLSLLCVAVLLTAVADASSPLLRMDRACRNPKRTCQCRMLRLRGGLESAVDSEDDDGVAVLQNRVFQRLEGKDAHEDMLHEILDEMCDFMAFQNQSSPDSSVVALKKLAMGYEKMSADWVCLRCGRHTAPTDSYCKISLPDQSRSMPQALHHVQQGLNEEWNAASRSAHVTVGAGTWGWTETELLIRPNMSMALIGRPGNTCEGRWWWKEGSNGHATGINFLYQHPLRPPYRYGVPTPYLEEEFGWEEFEQFFRGEHPQYQPDEELDLVWSVLDVWGGPWELDHCSVKSIEAVCVGCAMDANVTLRHCEVGGLGMGERAACGVDVGQNAHCVLQDCVVGNGSCGAAAIQVTHEGRVSVDGCHVETVDWGVTVDDEGSARVVQSKFVDCIWGTWYLGLSGETSRWVLEDNEVQGPGWYDERRPLRLVERGNLVNDTELYHRDWQEDAKERFRQGKRDSFLQRNVYKAYGIHDEPRRRR